MYKKDSHTKFICLIPARKGSIRLKNKNLKLFNKQPLIFWTVKCAEDAGLKDIYVFTNCNNIKKFAKNLNISPLLTRPSHISKSNTKMIETIKYFEKTLSKKNIYFDALIILQPTSPLRKFSELKKAMKVFADQKPDTLVSGIELEKKLDPSKFMLLNEKSFIKKFNPFKKNEIILRDGPSILICSRNTIRNGKIYGKKTIGFKVSPDTFSDIDTEDEFITAELISKLKKNEKIS